ncbi:LLM class F420-dependent oxidoreductase [Candidatus Poriferisodalis sp.]|uniref:LLM class F420-dependent oxidoreductase n=1 Tax=Candidatus Poriferisodalis sp. TaxID=3101277 RepID=UPI003B011007
MKFGAAFGNVDMGLDWPVIRRLVQELETAGFDGISTNDHVIGGHPDRAEGERVHTSATGVHEPLVFLSFIAAVTERVELATGVLLLPQRQTTLAAKQCAELDLLSGGRLRLGVGIGRNWMEYEALNEEFANRGRRIEEQVEILRRYWTDEHVTYEGQWHRLDRVGLNPMPVQRPIPIWMGSFFGFVSERVLERIGRMADGWMPQFPPADLEPILERVKGYARGAGRDPAELGIECAIRTRPDDDPSRWVDLAEAYRDLGATHLKVFAAGDTPADIVALMRRWLDAVGPAVATD